MSLLVRRAGPPDVEALARLLGEMQTHYGAPVPHEQSVQAAIVLCELPPEGFNPRTLLAIDEGNAIGSCVLNVMLPAAELRRSLYIRDLYVSARARRRGTGRALVAGAAKLVREGDFCALEWTTDSMNLPARRLYDGAGGRVLGRTYYRIELGSLGRLLDGEALPGPGAEEEAAPPVSRAGGGE